jgi:hypothetical protein
MKTYRVIVTYQRQTEFSATLRAEDETQARRLAARLAAACGWSELPKQIVATEIREAA